MPNPIQASLDPATCSQPDDITAAENDAQMSLSSAHSASSPQAPPSPAVSVLVSRFTTPTGMHPPVEPSLTKALSDCKFEITTSVVGVAAVLASAPVGVAAYIIGGARIGLSVASADRCVTRSEAQQVLDGERANQAADCRNEGAVPLTTTEGAVVCAK